MLVALGCMVCTCTEMYESHIRQPHHDNDFLIARLDGVVLDAKPLVELESMPDDAASAVLAQVRWWRDSQNQG